MGFDRSLLLFQGHGAFFDLGSRLTLRASHGLLFAVACCLLAELSSPVGEGSSVVNSAARLGHPCHRASVVQVAQQCLRLGALASGLGALSPCVEGASVVNSAARLGARLSRCKLRS